MGHPQYTQAGALLEISLLHSGHNIIAINPFQNPPPYEQLLGNLSGYYSRRINIQHRLVYEIYNEPVIENEIQYEGTILVARMWTHYDNVR